MIHVGIRRERTEGGDESRITKGWKSQDDLHQDGSHITCNITCSAPALVSDWLETHLQVH